MHNVMLMLNNSKAFYTFRVLQKQHEHFFTNLKEKMLAILFSEIFFSFNVDVQ